jgi:metal-responsive CopG/Arc/MetJ family transcriptional regulator
MGVKRINVTLPEDVIKILDKRTKSGEKSAYIADAVRAYSHKQSKQLLVQEMIRGYQATFHEDLEDNTTWENVLNDGSDD